VASTASDARIELPELPRREPYGTVLGSVIVFVVIVVLVGTLIVVDDNVSGTEEIPPGTTITVAAGVTYVPADGWFLDRPDTQPGSKSAIAKEGSSFTVQGTDWQGTLAEEVDRNRRIIAANSSLRLAGDEASFRTAGGLAGTRLAFAGPQVQGRAWIALDEAIGRSVVMITVSLPEVYERASTEVDAMLDSVRLTGAGA
jgi:hypothetical protein